MRAIRPVVLALLLIAGLAAFSATAQESRPASDSEPCPNIVIGFVGGFVHRNDLRHSEVQLGQRLQSVYGSGVHVQILENRQTMEAQREILHWLDHDHDGELSLLEKQQAHIILFGHSWGGAAAVSLARDLQKTGIPVLLTVQVDAVSKIGEDASIIPGNVNEAVNFYQTGRLLHGYSQIKAADLSRTRILGNFRFDYTKEPPECREYPWYDRVLFKGHTAIECDPRVWSQVEDLIRARVSTALVSSRIQLSTDQGN
jgi:hypothetical protein